MPSPPSSSTVSSNPSPVLGRFDAPWWAAAVVLGSLLLALRRVDGLVHPQLFGEDGPVFMTEAFLRSWPSSVFHPYNGYVHLLPRLWAELTTLIPVRLLPLSYTVFALAVTAGCYSLVLSPRLRWLIPNDGLRVLAFLALIALPGSNEIIGTLTNAIWPIGVALVLLSLSDRPESAAGRGAEFGAVGALGLTGVMSMLVVPAFFLRWRRRHETHDLRVLILITACAAIQGMTLVLSGQRNGTGSDLGDPSEIARALLVRIWGTLAVGERVLTEMLPRSVSPVVWVLCALGVAITVAAVALTPASFRGSFLATLALTSAATVWAYGGPFDPVGHAADRAGRYFVIPMILVVLAWFAASARLAPRWGFPRLMAAALPVVLLGFSVAGDFLLPRRPTVDWPATAACIVANRVCPIPMNPPASSFDLPPIPGARG